LNVNDKSKPKILQDVKCGKERPWRPKKKKNIVLSKSLHRLEQDKKANRVWWCSGCLTFIKNTGTGEMSLKTANFCRERLCPMCQWRRSLKVFCQVSKVMDVVQQRRDDLEPVFISLTERNCAGEELKNRIGEIFQGWGNFSDHYKIRKIVVGWFRALEVEYDGDEIISEERYERNTGYYNRIGIKAGDANPNCDTFHPHIHAILMMEKSYFKSKDYMHTTDWVKLWRTSMGLDYDPICDIRAVKKNKARQKEVAEVAKYTFKDNEILTHDNDLTDKLVGILGDALRYRRLFAFGGLLKDVAKELGAERPDEGDLVNVDDEKVREDIATLLEVYCWNFGLSNYVRDEVEG
jgi:plasmid rolling circle replication initiator protein Rep